MSENKPTPPKGRTVYYGPNANIMIVYCICGFLIAMAVCYFTSLNDNN